MASQNRTTASDRGKIIDDIPDQTVTIGTATAVDSSSATVAFTAGSVATGGPVTFFTATSTPDSLTGSSSSSPITVSGLTADTSYTFKVKAGNTTGFSSAGESAASNSIVPPLDTSYESIATVTVGGGGAATVTFSSIPTTFAHLQLRMTALGSGDPTIKINTTLPTKGHHLVGTGSVVSAEHVYGDYLDYAYALSASNPSVGVLDFLDYTNTNKNKTLRYLYGQDRNGSGEVLLGSKLWNSTATISSITITATINQYSSFALYGIKGV